MHKKKTLSHPTLHPTPINISFISTLLFLNSTQKQFKSHGRGRSVVARHRYQPPLCVFIVYRFLHTSYYEATISIEIIISNSVHIILANSSGALARWLIWIFLFVFYFNFRL